MNALNNVSTLVLKIVIILVALGALSFAFIVIPDETNPKDLRELWPFFGGIYVANFTFVFALFQTFKILTYVDQNISFSEKTVRALKMIKYSSIIFSLIFMAMLPFMFVAAQNEDAPGFAAFGMIMVLGSMAAATGAVVLEKVIRNAITIKSENELTV